MSNTKSVLSTACCHKMVNISTSSQWKGCHSSTCISMAVAWRCNTKRNRLSCPLHSEVRHAPHKAPCQWNSLGQLHIFPFFFLGLYHTLRSFMNERAGWLDHKTCLNFVRACQQMHRLRHVLSVIKWNRSTNHADLLLCWSSVWSTAAPTHRGKSGEIVICSINGFNKPQL